MIRRIFYFCFGILLSFWGNVFGEWIETDAMLKMRFFHVSVRLNDGRILVAGGWNGGQESPSYPLLCEVYDPKTNTWLSAGNLQRGRELARAVILPNGNVLIVGGYNSNEGYLEYCEVYDPSANTWTSTSSMSVKRAKHTATLLKDGKILITGGQNSSGALTSCEIYDPETGTWSITGALNVARFFHSAVLLADGRVLVSGGIGSDDTSISDCEIYDPTSGTWSVIAPMNYDRAAHNSLLLPNGKVIVVGGAKHYAAPTLPQDIAIDICELYDPSTGKWELTDSLNTKRYAHGSTEIAAVIPEGLIGGGVVVAGGAQELDSNPYFKTIPDVEVYSLQNGTWQIVEPLNTERAGFTLHLLPDGRLLAIGGISETGEGFTTVLTSCEIYNPSLKIKQNGPYLGFCFEKPISENSLSYYYGEIITDIVIKEPIIWVQDLEGNITTGYIFVGRHVDSEVVFNLTSEEYENLKSSATGAQLSGNLLKDLITDQPSEFFSTGWSYVPKWYAPAELPKYVLPVIAEYGWEQIITDFNEYPNYPFWKINPYDPSRSVYNVLLEAFLMRIKASLNEKILTFVHYNDWAQEFLSEGAKSALEKWNTGQEVSSEKIEMLAEDILKMLNDSSFKKYASLEEKISFTLVGNTAELYRIAKSVSGIMTIVNVGADVLDTLFILQAAPQALKQLKEFKSVIYEKCDVNSGLSQGVKDAIDILEKDLEKMSSSDFVQNLISFISSKMYAQGGFISSIELIDAAASAASLVGISVPISLPFKVVMNLIADDWAGSGQRISQLIIAATLAENFYEKEELRKFSYPIALAYVSIEEKQQALWTVKLWNKIHGDSSPLEEFDTTYLKIAVTPNPGEATEETKQQFLDIQNKLTTQIEEYNNLSNSIYTSVSTEVIKSYPFVGYIEGRVYNSSDESNLTGAVVEVYQDSILISSVTVDSTGKYFIVVDTGTYWIFVSSIGYMGKLNKNITVNSGQTTTLNVSLKDGDTGLAGYWKFDEGEGSIAFDYSGYRNHGKIYGASWTTGKVNGALYFDGVDDYVNLGSDIWNNTELAKGTIEAWFKTNDASVRQRIIDLEGVVLSEISFTGYPEKLHGNIYDGVDNLLVTTAILQANILYHTAITWNGVTSKLYFDGIEEDAVSAGSPVFDTFNRINSIGSDYNLETLFNGIIDEVRIYNYVRSAKQIAEDAQITEGTVTGKVTKLDGTTPVKDALVEVMESWVVIKSTLTKIDGSFEFSLSSGSYQIRVSKSGYETQTNSSIEIDIGQTTEINFILNKVGITTATVMGKVTESDGVTAILGAMVEVRDSSSQVLISSTTTDSNGNYSLVISSGIYDIKAKATGYQETIIERVSISGGEEKVVNFTLNQLTETGKPDLIISDFVASSTFPLKGENVVITIVVKNQRDAGSGAFFVDFYQNLSEPPSLAQVGDQYWRPTSLASGATVEFKYTFTFPGGEIKCYAQVDTDNDITESNENNNVSDGLIIKEPQEIGTLSGYVYSKVDGESIDGAKITCNGSITFTNIDGSYNLSLYPGDYTVYCWKEGFSTATVNVTISAGEITNKVFYLELPKVTEGVIYGKVTKEDGVTGISNAQVSLIEEGAEKEYMLSTYLGDYRFIVEEGTYTIRVTKDGYRSKEITVYIKAGEGKEINFALTFIVLPPLPVENLEATALGNSTVALDWIPSPTEEVRYYNVYYTYGTFSDVSELIGKLFAEPKIQVSPREISHWQSETLLRGERYYFSVRPVALIDGRYIENFDVNNIASCVVIEETHGVKARIKVPYSGKKVSGNRLTVVAEVYLNPSEVKEVKFEYKPSYSDTWTDIPPATTRHPNPDSSWPYFVHWDVSNLENGNYDIRAVAYDTLGGKDTSPDYITIIVNHVDKDVEEIVDADGKHIKREKVHRGRKRRIKAGSMEEEGLTEVVISTNTLENNEDTVEITLNPDLVSGPLASLVAVKAREVKLGSGQKNLPEEAEIYIPYDDSDGDGYIEIDGNETKYTADDLVVWSYDEKEGRWEEEKNIEVDRDKRRVKVKTNHFSYFSIFVKINNIRVYPNPFIPYDGIDDNGKPYSEEDITSGIIFDNLPSKVKISIYDIRGRVLRKIESENSGGTIRWDGKDEDGNELSSGGYIYVIETDKEAKRGKIAIIR